MMIEKLNKQPHHGNVRFYSEVRKITKEFPIVVIKYRLTFSHLDKMRNSIIATEVKVLGKCGSYTLKIDWTFHVQSYHDGEDDYDDDYGSMRHIHIDWRLIDDQPILKLSSQILSANTRRPNLHTYSNFGQTVFSQKCVLLQTSKSNYQRIPHPSTPITSRS